MGMSVNGTNQDRGKDVYVEDAWWEPDMEAWFSHLRSTLYQSDERPLNALVEKIRANWNNVDVTFCKTPASRCFRVCCKQCKQCSYGKYGSWAVQNKFDTKERCRADLAQFFNVKEVPVGRPSV